MGNKRAGNGNGSGDETPAAPLSTVRKCRVEFSSHGPGWTARGGPGQLIDVAQPIPGAPNGLTVADITDPSWFEDVRE